MAFLFSFSLIFFLLSCEQDSKIDANPIDYVGIGVRIKITGEVPEVKESFAGGPAFVAGVRSGDLILAIDDFKAYQKSLAEIVQRLRGKKNSVLVLKIKSKKGEVRSLKLTRTHVIKTVIGDKNDKEYLPE